ncbi:hypothetical protein TNCV_5137861 [Trichonephila clavipes]|nr:hypothetical protein TNCV_5137861 [Trichonephila clavipes]
MEVDHERSWKRLWTDEAHLYLAGYINRQNCRISGTENTLATQIVPLHTTKVTVCEESTEGAFGNARFISRHFITVLLPRSPDLNPLSGHLPPEKLFRKRLLLF